MVVWAAVRHQSEVGEDEVVRAEVVSGTMDQARSGESGWESWDPAEDG